MRINAISPEEGHLSFDCDNHGRALSLEVANLIDGKGSGEYSDLPAPSDALGTGTRLRGYYQINGTDHNSRYLGPLIIARMYDPKYPKGGIVTTPTGSWQNGKPTRCPVRKPSWYGRRG